MLAVIGQVRETGEALIIMTDGHKSPYNTKVIRIEWKLLLFLLLSKSLTRNFRTNINTND